MERADALLQFAEFGTQPMFMVEFVADVGIELGDFGLEMTEFRRRLIGIFFCGCKRRAKREAENDGESGENFF
ncbi:MAG: hypothetical protein ACRER1_01900 [Gammaproteobacteria bacterium]